MHEVFICYKTREKQFTEELMVGMIHHTWLHYTSKK